MNSNEESMRLAGRYLDGQATHEETARLERLMLEDPQFRADFLTCARVDAALPGAVGDRGGLAEFAPARSARSGWKHWLPTEIAAALLILAGILWWGASQSPPPRRVATFKELEECRWVNPNTSVRPGDAIAIGERIELSSGSANIVFHTGARLKLTGPAIVEARTDNSVFLTMGEAHLVAETPAAKGFIIETPNSRFVDISTAFTATVSPDGLSRLEVTDGEVDVLLAGVAKPRRLQAGVALYVEPGRLKVVTLIEAGDGTAAFRFPSIPPPSRADYADQASGNATVRVALGELQGEPKQGGPVAALIDGVGQSQQDSPRESVFFRTRSGGAVLMDLGRTVSISRINTYSWHQHEAIEEHRERARQRFVLYGFSGDEPPDIQLPPEDSGWTRIARVNSDRFFRVNERLDRPAQQACSISAAHGDIGRFRYLLWELMPNTFYGEFDVYASPVAPLK